MKGILLAAGIGSRMRPLTDIAPKCLMPVNGRPLMEYWLRAFKTAGVNPVLINLHHHADLVAAWLGSRNFSNDISVVYEERLLGTAGTVAANRSFSGNASVMIVHADNLCGADLSEFIRAHEARPHGTEMTMMTFTASNPRSCGVVKLDELGRVVEFHEKVENPPGNLANAAVYIIEPSVLEFLASFNRPYIDFSTEVLPCYLGRIFTYHNRGFHQDIGSLEAYLTAQYTFDSPRFPSGGHEVTVHGCPDVPVRNTEGSPVRATGISPEVRDDREKSDNKGLSVCRFPGRNIQTPVNNYHEGRSPNVQRGNFQLPAQLIDALGKALDAGIADLAEDVHSSLSSAADLLEEKDFIILRVKNLCSHGRIEKITSAVSERFAGRLDRVLACFQWVPAGFSSKALYDRFDVKTLAVNALSSTNTFEEPDQETGGQSPSTPLSMFPIDVG